MSKWRNDKKRQRTKMQKPLRTIKLEIDFLRGLSSFVIKELKSYGLEPIQSTPNSLQLAFRGNLNSLNNLKTVVAVYQLLEFEIPRPKALLGQQNFQQLSDAIKDIVNQKQKYKAFRINAAGRESAVIQRLAQEITKNTGLKYDPKNGELLIRIRKKDKHWQVLLRIGPKPLSARSWRVCNMPGGLNATVAYAMNDLARIKASDEYLNAMCGSGTLLIENNKAGHSIGLDNNQAALNCAQENLQTAKIKAKLILGDALKSAFDDASFNVISADLPWGDAIGKHTENTALYKGFLQEAARISKTDARLVLLTHELRVFERIMQQQSTWLIEKDMQVYHGGHYPKIYLLTKTP